MSIQKLNSTVFHIERSGKYKLISIFNRYDESFTCAQPIGYIFAENKHKFTKDECELIENKCKIITDSLINIQLNTKDIHAILLVLDQYSNIVEVTRDKFSTLINTYASLKAGNDKNEKSINNASNCFPYKINIQYFEYDSRYGKASFVYTVDKMDNKTVLAEMISESGYYSQDLHGITERLLEDMKNLDKTEESVET